MAKRTYGYTHATGRDGSHEGHVTVVEMQKAGKGKRYDYVDRGRGAKDAANAVANGLTTLIFGRKK
jgi:hypothetical protein